MWASLIVRIVVGGFATGQCDLAKLSASDASAGDDFGSAVAGQDSAVAIGARFDDAQGQLSGSVHIFTFAGGEWSQAAKLLPSDPEPMSWFGQCVAMRGDIVAAGRPRGAGSVAESGAV